METTLEARVIIKVDTTGGRTKLRETLFNLILPNEIDQEKYFDKEGMPTTEGSKMISTILTQGLVANIQASHQFKQIDSAQHLRKVIEDLEKGFIAVTDSSKGTFEG